MGNQSHHMSYSSAYRKYISFCTMLNISSFPTSEHALSQFVALLAQGLKHHSIKCYLSAVNFAQIEQGFGDTFCGKVTLMLNHVLTGINVLKPVKLSHQSPDYPLPQQLLVAYRQSGAWTLHIQIWLFYGQQHAWDNLVFSRPVNSLFRLPNHNDPEVHLSLSDLAMDSHSAPSLVRLRIKQSKTDSFTQA